MAITVIKRNGNEQGFNKEKIKNAILKAAIAVGGNNGLIAGKLANQVENILIREFDNKKVTVEEIQNIVEKVLVENGHYKTSKAFILYRERRANGRDKDALLYATRNAFDQYLSDDDMAVRLNANTSYSIAGLNNYLKEEFTKLYWLNEIYPVEIKESHVSGDYHIHDLGFFGSYCVGWDLKQLLVKGFTGVEGKIASKPAKHLRSFLGQVVNFTFTTTNETAGAQAWSSFDTYCAPFIRYDNLTYKQVKQAMQEFIYNLNVATRVGFQCPFTNITMDLKCPKTLKDEPVICGGVFMEQTYGEFQVEMDMINKAFCEVMLEGDGNGRVFSFPIPTINITKETDFSGEVMSAYMEITTKYGIPYFANYINADLNPEDAVSMCCRLRLNVKELRKKGGGLFGANPLTGSIGVVTINLPRIGYLSKNKEEFFARLSRLSDLAKESLEIKRKVIEKHTESGLYPYCEYYLREVKERTGGYWSNHFNTIGICGMNEACLNFMKRDITTPEGQQFALETMNFLRDKMIKYQEETSHQYNLEATPAESTAARFARTDVKRFDNIITAGKKENPYYTNSTQLPVGYTNDIFKVVQLQDELQSLYTGGTVLHLYIGEKIEDKDTCKQLIQKIFTKSKMPYISITPTFSICNNHGYFAGEHFDCPICKQKAEVWTRVTGFLRNYNNFNDGKKQEYLDRTFFKADGKLS